MKTTILKNWMAAMLLTATCGCLVACDNDDEGHTPPPAPADVSAVVGTYNGTMTIFELLPNESGKEPAGTQLNATVTDDAIQFLDFPIRDLIINVLGDETQADLIVEKIGEVNYSVPYTALMSEDNASVTLTLTPEPLILTLSNDGENGGIESLEEPVTIQIDVEIVAQGEGSYTIESGKFGFRISVASVKLGENVLPGFNPFTLEFNLAKN